MDISFSLGKTEGIFVGVAVGCWCKAPRNELEALLSESLGCARYRSSPRAAMRAQRSAGLRS